MTWAVMEGQIRYPDLKCLCKYVTWEPLPGEATLSAKDNPDAIIRVFGFLLGTVFWCYYLIIKKSWFINKFGFLRFNLRVENPNHYPALWICKDSANVEMSILIGSANKF